MTITSALTRLIPAREASAHCDIPCGIYDPVSAKIAAQTVQKMVLRIESLDSSDDVSSSNTLSRYITVKEEHAELCKHELRVLWADYTWPGTDANEIAAKFNAALKLASQCKQTVSMDNAEASGCGRGRHRHRILVHQRRGVQRPGFRRPLRRLGISTSEDSQGAFYWTPSDFSRNWRYARRE